METEIIQTSHAFFPLIIAGIALIVGSVSAVKISGDIETNTENELKMKEIALKEMQTVGTTEQIEVQEAISRKYVIPAVALTVAVVAWTQRSVIGQGIRKIL